MIRENAHAHYQSFPVKLAMTVCPGRSCAHADSLGGRTKMAVDWFEPKVYLNYKIAFICKTNKFLNSRDKAGNKGIKF